MTDQALRAKIEAVLDHPEMDCHHNGDHDVCVSPCGVVHIYDDGDYGYHEKGENALQIVIIGKENEE